jgi:hypothetical protein
MADYDVGNMNDAIASESGGQLAVNVVQPEGDGAGEHLAIGLKAGEPGVIRINDKRVDGVRISISGRDEIAAFFSAVAAAGQ